MNSKNLEALDALERVVFKSTRPIVVALTGGWGEGKTYFWKTVVATKHADQKPGYVSVFGADSLAAIRERVVLATNPVADAGLWKKAWASAGSWIRAALNHFGEKYLLSDSIAVELLQSFALKKQWIVCIDDIERLSDAVEIENFLGYVSELRDKFELKVVLIFNVEPFNQAPDSAFHRYQEKVIDRAIPFALDLQDIVALVFKDLKVTGMDVAVDVQAKADILGLRNIRLLLKVRSYFEDVLAALDPNTSPEFLRSALVSLLLFVYTKFSNQKPDGLTFEMLESHSEWNDRFRRSAKIEQDEANDPARDLAKALLEKYKYAATDDLDHLLMAFVRGDALHVANLRTIYAAYTQESNKRAADRDLQTMWDTQYHGKLGDNSQELCDAIEHAVVPDLPYISPGELDVALRVLSTFGRKEKATELFEEFKRQRGHVFEGLSADSMPHGNYSYQQLKCYFSDIADAHKFDTRSLAEVMSSAFDEKFITSVDGARISEFTADNLVDYFMKNPQPKLTSKLRLLTQANDEPVRRMAYEAAEKIAATSSLDHMRMEGMGLLLKGPPADSNVGNA